MEFITSVKSPKIKDVIALNDRKVRDLRQETVVEGDKEIGLAMGSGAKVKSAFICREIIKTDLSRTHLDKLIQLSQKGLVRVYEVTPDVFSKIAYRESTGGIVLVVGYKDVSLNKLSIKNNAFIVIIEGAEKPGNIGAILRTCDAAGVDALIVSTDSGDLHGTDIHNPNVVRASIGSFFTVQTAQCKTEELLKWLAENEIRLVGASPYGNKKYTEFNFNGSVAIALGSEAFGLSKKLTDRCDEAVFIPIRGSVDSLNLSVSAALFIYEVVRQRGND